MTVQFYEGRTGTTAYKQMVAEKPVSLFFLSGHSGTFDSPVRQVLTDFSAEHAVPLTHFAYFGRDQSHSKFIPENGAGYLQHWLDQTLEIFDVVTTGPQILIGSSMGGYMALALAQARPDRVVGIVGLAAGFGIELADNIQQHYDELRVGTANEAGFKFEVAADNSLPITGRLNISCPVRLLHAMSDDIVAYKNTDHIAKAVMTDDVIIRLTKDGDHKLNRPRDVMWLNHALAELIG